MKEPTTIEEGQQFREQLARTVLNRAMKGVHRGRPKGTPKQIEDFCTRFQALAFWVADHMPRDMSASIGAVTFKAALFYGLEKAEKFCVTVAKGTFNGADDPAHLIWMAMQRNRGKERAVENYQRAVCAARAYCEGRRVRHLSPAKTDIFEWEMGLKLPTALEKNFAVIGESIKPLPPEA